MNLGGLNGEESIREVGLETLDVHGSTPRESLGEESTFGRITSDAQGLGSLFDLDGQVGSRGTLGHLHGEFKVERSFLDLVRSRSRNGGLEGRRRRNVRNEDWRLEHLALGRFRRRRMDAKDGSLHRGFLDGVRGGRHVTSHTTITGQEGLDNGTGEHN